MVHAIANLTADENIGLSIAHFKKKDGALYSSKFSVIEVLVEVSEKSIINFKMIAQLQCKWKKAFFLSK